MHRHSRTGLVCLIALTLAGGPAAGRSQAVGAAVAGEVVVNMRGVDIHDVSEQIARITGRTIVLDPNVSGVVTVVSASRCRPTASGTCSRPCCGPTVSRPCAAARSGGSCRRPR